MTKQSIMDALKLHNVFCYAIAEGVMAEEVYTINGVSGSGWRFFLANTTMQEVKDWLGY